MALISAEPALRYKGCRFPRRRVRPCFAQSSHGDPGQRASRYRPAPARNQALGCSPEANRYFAAGRSGHGRNEIAYDRDSLCAADLLAPELALDRQDDRPYRCCPVRQWVPPSNPNLGLQLGMARADLEFCSIGIDDGHSDSPYQGHSKSFVLAAGLPCDLLCLTG